ncbi:MAG TPA: hypothetical protein VF753_15300 [Terriglobales bacterium]
MAELNTMESPNSADIYVSEIRKAYQKDHDAAKAFGVITRRLEIGEARTRGDWSVQPVAAAAW